MGVFLLLFQRILLSKKMTWLVASLRLGMAHPHVQRKSEEITTEASFRSRRDSSAGKMLNTQVPGPEFDLFLLRSGFHQPLMTGIFRKAQYLSWGPTGPSTHNLRLAPGPGWMALPGLVPGNLLSILRAEESTSRQWLPGEPQDLAGQSAPRVACSCSVGSQAAQ